MRSPRPEPQPTLFEAAPLPVAPLNHRARLACLRLIRADNVGPATFRELINHFGGAEAALDALPELARRGGRGRAMRIPSIAEAEAELEAAANAGVAMVFTIEPGYPPLLAHIEAPPPLVYLRGRAELLARETLAIVGSRQASAAGMSLARTFARGLGAAGLVVVSGLARGIDAAAHEAALATGTIAVVAGGVDVIYPPENADLHERIAREGCLLGERPVGLVPRAKDFPRRNRLISGLSRGVVVIEAARRSGTLITARMAAEQGREVFAVPGHPLDPRAEGTNHLLKQGATLVTEAADVLALLAPQMAAPHPRAAGKPRLNEPDPSTSPRPPPLPLSDGERGAVLAALGPAPVAIDEVARTTGLAMRALGAALIELDLAGRIERHGHGLVSLRMADESS